jgi:HK97 family phage prohead protease
MTDLARRAERRNWSKTFDSSGMELRASSDGKTLTFEGIASTTNDPYEMHDMFGSYTEVIDSGAFTRTLAQNPDVVLLVNHAGLPLASTKAGTMQLSERDAGLWVEAELVASDPDVQRVAPKMKRGDLTEMSFAFYIERQQWSPDYMQVNIQEVNLNRGDVSVVTYGANPNTSSSLRSLVGEDADFDSALDAVKRGDATPAQRDLVARAATILTDLTSEPTPEPVVDPMIDIWRKRLELAAK